MATKRERKGYNLNLWIDEAVGAALNRYLDAPGELRPTRTSFVEAALRDLLKKVGAWPETSASAPPAAAPSPEGKGKARKKKEG